jgi:predicted ATP-grasp superfamily ATP-dependent carboligase
MKNKIILVGKDGRPSMKGVYSKMTNKEVSLLVRRRLLSGKEYYRHYQNNNVETLTKEPISSVTGKNSIVIRWGNKIVIPTDKSTIVYNNASAIALATDKKVSREIFINKGINTPRLIYLATENNIKYPIIARPFVHSKGKNFVVLNNFDELNVHLHSNTGWYYSEFVDKVKEFRVHCAHGKILNYLEKPNPKNGNIAWNIAQNGEAFTNVNWSDYNYDVASEALKAITALGLDFGGVDVMLDNEGKAWVLEVNTAATLSSAEYSMERYAKYFEWLFRSETRREHWDYTKFKKAKSLAWKNFQLLETKEEEDEE